MQKVFLLFGAGGFLGKYAAEFFLNKNYDEYYFFARTVPKLANHKKFNFFPVDDLSIEKNVEAAFDALKPDKNKLYFLYSTIGGYYGGTSVAETPYEEWKKMLDINLNSAFLISKNFMKLAGASSGGSICFTSAYSSLFPEEKKSAYSVSKSALNFLVKVLSKEGKEKSISANAVAPFIIDTPENRKWIEDISTMVGTETICSEVENLFFNSKTTSGEIIGLPRD
ncbi:MAG: SDR family oxidoreductase [Ignavibacteriales bacterium]|nr:SDR family oxidoreductase [Ignavibacteriales bacterium]